MSGIAGKVALVTGGGAGIGAACAERLAEAGALVGVADIEADHAVRVADALRSQGREAIPLTLDVRDGGAIRAAVAELRDRLGPVEVVISNAGLARHGRVEEFSESDWDLVFDVNVRAHFRLVAAVAPEMRARQQGSIVLLSSVHAFATSTMVAAYAASKAAVVGLARGLAIDYAQDGIRINAVAPGSVDTPLLAASAARRNPEDPAAAIEDWGRQHPIGRVLTPAEVAAAVVFLAGPESSGITGTCQVVDGGLLARLSL